MVALRARYPRLRTAVESDASSSARWLQRSHEPCARASQGVDFAFFYIRAGVPVLWPADKPLIVRTMGIGKPSVHTDLDRVLSELRELTGLQLQRHDTDRSDDRTYAPGEIRVVLDSPARHRGCSALSTPQTRSSLAVRHAGPSRVGNMLSAGLVPLGHASCTGALSDDLLQLRHGFGHALGLHHANRGGHVMSSIRFADQWTFGDVAGLRRAGQGPSVNHD